MEDSRQYKITVWMDKDYSKSEGFQCPFTWSKKQIKDEADRLYKGWYYIDIWHYSKWKD